MPAPTVTQPQGLCVWDILNGMRDALSNPLYKPSDEHIVIRSVLLNLSIMFYIPIYLPKPKHLVGS